MSERADPGRIPVERWWPPLSIDAKHRVLAAIERAGEDAEVPLDEALRAEIGAADEAREAPARLTPRECDFIRTQIEPVD